MRYRIKDIAIAWQAIVIDGGLRTNGMPAWKDYLVREEADAIKSYVIHEATLGFQRGEKRLVRQYNGKKKGAFNEWNRTVA